MAAQFILFTPTPYFPYSYNSTGNLSSITNGLGQTSTFSSYNGLGLPGSITDADNATTQLSYDARGRVSSMTRSIAGAARTTIYEYNPLGLLSKTTDPIGSESRSYDAAGYLTAVYRGTSQEGHRIHYA